MEKAERLSLKSLDTASNSSSNETVSVSKRPSDDGLLGGGACSVSPTAQLTEIDVDKQPRSQYTAAAGAASASSHQRASVAVPACCVSGSCTTSAGCNYAKDKELTKIHEDIGLPLAV